MNDQIKGFKNEISQARKSKDNFFTWFDSATDTQASFIRGAWDFSVHILNPVSKYISTPENKTVLEIGFGGGRILAAAAAYFDKIIGVDIHDEAEYVSNELNQRGINNVTLLKSDGSSLPVGNKSIDLVYSFIVFQHLGKIDVFDNYFKEISRVLKNSGIAIIYTGRYTRYSPGRFLKLYVFVDRILELLLLKGGYKEKDTSVNHINLLVSRKYIKRICRKNNLKILGWLVSRKKVPDGIRKYGKQYGNVITKSDYKHADD